MADSAKSVGESFKNGFDNVKDWFKGVGKSLSDVFTTAFDFVWKYIGPYVTGIKNAFKMVVNAMKENIEDVKMIVENVVTILKMALLSTIIFITSTITNRWEEAKENMIAVWDNINEADKQGWFGIKNFFY
ncbi:hypothetical protein [Enterococcus faecalis]|uniref:hypothetical protein n=1 Tax=Enterococcus faecalis TaxID=1351 RepID=UPI003D9FD8FC